MTTLSFGLLEVEINDDLIALADAWPTREDSDHGRRLTRCGEEACEQEIVPPERAGRLAHLMNAHGYRMDGRAWGNQNEYLGTAGEELVRRGGR